jgi:hypothetical protein
MLTLRENNNVLTKERCHLMEGNALQYAQHGDFAKALRVQAAEYMTGLLDKTSLLALQEPRRIAAVCDLIPNLEYIWRQAVEAAFTTCGEHVYTELRSSLPRLDRLLLKPFSIELRENAVPMLMVCPWCGEEHAILYRVTPIEFQTILFRRTIAKFGLAPCVHPLPISDSLWRIIQNEKYILDSPVT